MGVFVPLYGITHNSVVNHPKDTKDKKNATGSKTSGRSNHNTDNQSNDSRKTY